MARKNRRNGKQRGNGNPAWELSHTRLTTPSLVVPQEMVVKLAYPVNTIVSGAVTDKSQRWTVNAAYDVDPVLGSTSTPGFAEWAAFYKFYRVIAYTADVQFGNLDAGPRAVYIINANDDPGTSASGFIDRPSNEFNEVHYAGHVYCDRHRVTRHYQCSKIAGTGAVETDDSYAALASTVPNNKIYFGVGVHSLDGTNLANGVSFIIYLTMTIRFYERVMNLTNTPSAQEAHADFERKRHAWKVSQGQSSRQ